jgi:hypothetical protein
MQRSTAFYVLPAFGAGLLLAALLLEPRIRAVFSIPGAGANSGLYAPRDWDRGTPAKLNISIFTFSDRNHNGRYDLPDKPLNRIAVRLLRPDGSTRIERSNINGFANFSMQLDGGDGDIRTVDEPYQFEVLPPPEWSVTTGNASQEIRFKSVAGAIAGMGAHNPPAVVGLTPPSRLSGAWPAHADASLRLLGDSGVASLALNGRGEFSTLVQPGNWRLEKPAQDLNEPIFTVAYGPVRLAQPIPSTPGRETQWLPVTVDFDDLTRSSIDKIAAGYAGLDWDYLLAVDNQFYKGPGYINGLMSGANVAYNSSGHPVTIRAMEPRARFDFVGGYFSVAWHNAEGETLILRAWRDGVQLAEEQFALSHLAPTFLYADYRDITRLEIETRHYWQFVADDLSFRLPAAAKR